MQVQIIAEAKFRVVGVVEGGSCAALDFLSQGEAQTEASRLGLIEMLQFIAENGLDEAPSKWFHEVDKNSSIYEFIKGPLRLFFFKGKNGDIAICTTGLRKKSQKVDKGAVTKAISQKNLYLESIDSNTYTVISNEA